MKIAIIGAGSGYMFAARSERPASDAAVTGSRRLALQALMAHPFVTSKHTAEKILDEGLAAHRAHLPQFS